MNFLFWLFLFGLIIAFAQDVKRREVDNWLNLFLLISGSLYVIFSAKNYESVFLLFGFILFMFLVSNVCYYSRLFAGGDAKLLFAMTPFFVASTLSLSLFNLALFIFILLLVGSIYGLVYSLFLGIIHFKKMRTALTKEAKSLKLNYVLLFSLVFFVIGFFNSLVFILAIFILIFSLLFVYVKALEKVAMYRKVKGSELREGDWLVKDLKISNKVFKADFDGLSKKDIEFIKKTKKDILIKDGLPFVPAFLVAFLVYIFVYDFLLSWFFILF